MALHNPNNWHWVDKDVIEWARDWFNKNLVDVAAEQGDVNVKISKVVSADGDVNVSQRKGKVITYYDVKLVLEFSGMFDSCHLVAMSGLTKSRQRSWRRGRFGHVHRPGSHT